MLNSVRWEDRKLASVCHSETNEVKSKSPLALRFPGFFANAQNDKISFHSEWQKYSDFFIYLNFGGE